MLLLLGGCSLGGAGSQTWESRLILPRSTRSLGSFHKRSCLVAGLASSLQLQQKISTLHQYMLEADVMQRERERERERERVREREREREARSLAWQHEES